VCVCPCGALDGLGRELPDICLDPP